ncbi:DEAD/DEAH box helicase [Akkermansiaceae bacterium]|nr:DEAD/DEAH box helicase [Akkermansiaceae bacterium]
MDILSIHKSVIKDYESYIRSFIEIADQDIQESVENSINTGALWPEPLIQFNPAFLRDRLLEDLISEDVLHPALGHVFQGYSLFAHQTEAIRLGSGGQSFFVTSGTGSGKSLTYLGTVLDQLFKAEPKKGVQAILVYPMNALINSQIEELKKFEQNYLDSSGARLPFTFAQYTGQTPTEARDLINETPPNIILTNYMMLELILTRQSEGRMREAIFSNLRHLVFDELHTYRGRQGADVGMLIRRLRSHCSHQLKTIGTSATMVSTGSEKEQKKVIAKVAEQIFGESFGSHQIVGESLERSIPNSMSPPEQDALKKEVGENLPSSFTREFVQQSPTAIWLENRVAILEYADESKIPCLKRGTPLPLSEISAILAEDAQLSLEKCRSHLTSYLRSLHTLNQELLASCESGTILPYRLHQFISQTGAVYATLGTPKSKRTVTLSPGLYESKERFIYPHVFSRASGHSFICVHLHKDDHRIIPREFNSPNSSKTHLQSGYIVPEYGTTPDKFHWQEDEHLELLPPSWMNIRKDGSRSPKKDFAERIPNAIFYDELGNYSYKEDSKLPFRGWFMSAEKGLLFDPTAGLFFDGRTNERTKLTTLGNEGRSTSTTVSSVLILQQLAAAGIALKDQKLLSFTDNRQDAALQAGHFNDFMRVSQIRGAVARALEKNAGGLNFQTLGNAIVAELNLPFHSYATADEDTPDFLRTDYHKALETYVLYLAIYDIRRGWRVILPNLEKCGLLTFDYANIDAVLNQESDWAKIPIIGNTDKTQRRKFLHTTLEHFRREYAIHSTSLLDPDRIETHQRLISEKLRDPWRFSENDDFTSTFLRVEKLHPRERRKCSTLGLISGYGKYVKHFITNTLGADVKVNQDFYDEFIQALLSFLSKMDYLLASEAKGEGGRAIKVYRLKLDKLIWKPGDHRSVPQDQIKQRSYRVIKEAPNAFFQKLYLTDFSSMKTLIGADHTGQLSNEVRLEREARFRADWFDNPEKPEEQQVKSYNEPISALFCSPTMELGIDISNLSIVHMRNAPPNPANYAQRSGRAGRSGQGAIVFIYCSSYSPHDRHYFAEQDKLVAGAVEAPRLDLANRELIETHLNALVLGTVNLDQLKDSVTNLLDHEDRKNHYPLRPEVRDRLNLGEKQKSSISKQFYIALGDLAQQGRDAGWLTERWLEKHLDSFAIHLNSSLERWRSLYEEAWLQLEGATKAIKSGIYISKSREYRQAERRQSQATHCINLLRNERVVGHSTQLSEFYVFRYLASEGFLPGYNFTRLPVRVFLAQGDGGEYIARPRLIGLREFGPRNILYHRGLKYAVNQLLATDPRSSLHDAKICVSSGYWLDEAQKDRDLCPFTGVDLTDSKNRRLFQDLIPLGESRAIRRESITCEEEERSRLGFEIETFFSLPDGDQSRVQKAHILSGDEELLHLSYIPAAKLIQVNVKDRARSSDSFPLGFDTGIWHASTESPIKKAKTNETPEDVGLVMPYTHDTADALYIEPLKSLALERSGVLSLQFAFKRAIETHFQIEPSELGVTSMGGADSPNMFIYEAAEGSLGVLSQLVSNPETFTKIVNLAIKICHFDDPERTEPATYDDLLSYYNQPHHQDLDRWLIKDALNKLAVCRVETQTSQEPYEDQYQRLLSSYDSNSSTEREFLNYLYQNNLRLPDSAQKTVDGIYVRPDFFYEGDDAWIFCDGTPHDDPATKANDIKKRKAIIQRGDQVITFYYKDDLASLVRKYSDIFTKVR